MNHFQDYFNDASAGDEIGEGQLFQGGRYDPEQMKLFGFAHRAFHPKVQVWTAQDPASYVDGLNVYNAPSIEPINAVNPLGT